MEEHDHTFFSLKLAKYRKPALGEKKKKNRKIYSLIDAVVGTPNDQRERFSNREAEPKER